MPPQVTEKKQNTPQTSPGSLQTPPDWRSQGEVYLLSKGWVPNGVTDRGQVVYSDPRGNKNAPVLKPVGELRTVGGGKEVIKQMHGDPIPWDYVFEEALSVQQGRDKDEAKAQETAKAG